MHSGIAFATDKTALTKAVQNVVKVVEIVITFFHNCLVANRVIHPAVGICNCACAGWRNQDKEWEENWKSKENITGYKHLECGEQDGTFYLLANTCFFLWKQAPVLHSSAQAQGPHGVFLIIQQILYQINWVFQLHSLAHTCKAWHFRVVCHHLRWKGHRPAWLAKPGEFIL